MIKIDTKFFSVELDTKYVFMMLFSLFLIISLYGVVAEPNFNDVFQGHPLFEIDFSEGEANDDLSMGGHNIESVNELVSNHVESGSLDSDNIDVDELIIEENITFPEPGQVEFPSGAVFPFAMKDCPKGWSNLSESEGRIMVGLDDNSDILDVGGEKNVGLEVENLPNGSLNAFTEDVSGDLYYKHNDFYADGPTSLVVYPVSGPRVWRSIRQTDQMDGSHTHDIEFDAAGDGVEISNLQPYLTVRFCVKE